MMDLQTVPSQTTQKSDGVNTLKQPFRFLFTTYRDSVKSSKQNSTPIQVDEIASKVSRLYELIRKVVDWKEDTVLRRSAIERILKRLIFSKISGITFSREKNPDEVAEIVTIDLIRGGHLPNNQIPRENIKFVAQCLKKYFYILDKTEFNSLDPLTIKSKVNFYTFILDIAACEIEEILTNPVKENTLILTMTRVMHEKIKIKPDGYISPQDAYTQTFIAVCRTLYDMDDSFITYQLFKYQYPEWRNPDDTFIRHFQQQIMDIWKQTTTLLNHPLSKELNRVCEKTDTVFTMLSDFLSSYSDTPDIIVPAVEDKQAFLSKISSYYDARYLTLKKRLFRLGIFSTLSVFLSNSVTFYIIEVPLASLFYEGFNLFTTLIDFTIPTVAMFFLVSIIKPPAATNKIKLLQIVEQYIYEGQPETYEEIYTYKKRHPVIMFTIIFLYLTLTVSLFWGIGWIFYIARLPITSVIFDTATIAMTVFAAVLIRNKSKELSVEERSSGWEFLLDMISLPMAKIGSYLAAKWKEYNIVAIFFTFIIETPFALVIDFIESWSQFLKERRAELH